jgi:hypothetical protein
VNGQLSNKAYRLDHSLQTHFSERERRQNNVAMAGRHGATRDLDGRLANGGKMAPSERRQLEFGEARATRGSPTAAALRRASLRGCAVAGF